MRNSSALPCRNKQPLIGKLRLGLLAPVAIAVLMTSCSMFSKEAKQAKETADALAQALNPPSVRAEEPVGIVRGPEEFAIKAVAEKRLNLDAAGEPLSVVVRVIQLRDKNEFSRLSFDAVTSKNDNELFPKEFVAVSEVVFVPGETQEMSDKLLPEARYVGIVGFFRMPDAQHWRMLFDARSVRNEGLIIVAQDCYFTPITPQSEPLPGQTANTTPACSGTVLSKPPANRSRR